jgi:hypothetical protein
MNHKAHEGHEVQGALDLFVELACRSSALRAALAIAAPKRGDKLSV